MKKIKPVHIKKVQSTCEEFVNSLSPKEKRAFEEEYREFVVNELLLAAIAEDYTAIRELAKEAGIAPDIIQELNTEKHQSIALTTFNRILHTIGYEITIKPLE